MKDVTLVHPDQLFGVHITVDTNVGITLGPI